MHKARHWSYQIRLPAEVESVPRARHFVCSLLIDHRILYLVQDVQLVVSELATNAVRHAKTPFTVALEQVDPSSVLLTVSDRSPAPPVPPTNDLLHPGGRGLTIVDLVSRDWGVTRRSGEAKSVWASFALRTDMGELGQHA